MDLNLFLLKREEHVLLQTIDKIDKRGCNIMGRPFSFSEVRDGLSVIILSEDYNYIKSVLGPNISQTEINNVIAICEEERRKLEKEWKNEEQRIREAIDAERRRRDNPEYRECVEEWPELPNYRNPEGREPYPSPWNTLPVDDDNELFRDLINIVREEPVENSRYNYYRRFPYWDVERKLDGLYDAEYLMDTENLFEIELSNYHLMLLDERIKELRQYEQRLNASTLQGYFSRTYDGKGNETSRKIYLLLDNIQKSAYSASISWGRQVDRIEILANVYVHELFHAYYSESRKKHYFVSSIKEIEETMAEFGMLCFINEAFNHYFQTAYDCVKQKLGNQSLWCYGLGSRLYDILTTSGLGFNLFGGRIIEVYKAIQLSVRNSNQMITRIKGLLMSNPLDDNKYASLLFYLFDVHRRYKLSNPNGNNIKGGTSYYFFNGQTFGYNNWTVYAVLEHYIAINQPTFNTIAADFRQLYYQPHPCFEDKNIATADRYDFNRQMILSDGTTIVPRRAWSKDFNGDMYKFLILIDSLHRRGRIDHSVLFLG